MLNVELIAQNQYQKDMLHQAEQERLAREVIADRRKDAKTYNPALAWLGQRMMDMGSKLVAMSDSETEDGHRVYKPDVSAN